MSISPDKLLSLFRDGMALESIMSGWHLNEEKVAELVLRAYRAGDDVDPDWLLPASLRKPFAELLNEEAGLTNVEVSSHFRGKIGPAMVGALRVLKGEGRGLETRVYTESTFETALHDDLHGARSEIILVSPDVKGKHWRRYLEAFRRLRETGGTVTLFLRRISDLTVDDLRDTKLEIVEKHSHANLVLIDREILWEGSMNFLLPPDGEEHLRRTVSRLACGEILDLHDLA